jgi:hypothetical protein
MDEALSGSFTFCSDRREHPGSVLEIARSYRDDRGWKVIPLVDKRPICSNYVGRKYNASQFRNRNVGIVLGSWSNWLVDVDLDCPEAVELADLYLPATGSMFGRASKPRSHRLYRAVGATHEVFSDPFIADNKKVLLAEGVPKAEVDKLKSVMLELRSNTASGGARHTAFPGSTHPSGEAVRWDEDGEPRDESGGAKIPH